MTQSNLEKLYKNVKYKVETVIISDDSKVTAMRINRQHLIGSKGSVAVVSHPERDYLRFDELEIAFSGGYETTKVISVTLDCCPDTNILPYFGHNRFAYEVIRSRIDEELLKINHHVDAERVACIESCLDKLIKRIDK